MGGRSKFRSLAPTNDQVISKIQGRLARPRRGESERVPILLFPPIKQKAQAAPAPEVSASALLDRTAAEVKRLASSGQPTDEDFIRVARTLRETMKSELHKDPPMADVCLVVADALTFTSPAELQPGALSVLGTALQALGKPRGEQGDERLIFSQFIKAGWRVTPAYDESELMAWIEKMSS